MLGREDVDDDVAQIDEDPAAVAVALGARDRAAVGAYGLGDRVGDGAGLDVGAARRDDERVGDDRAALEGKDDDVFGFAVFGGGADDIDQVSQCAILRKRAVGGAGA